MVSIGPLLYNLFSLLFSPLTKVIYFIRLEFIYPQLILSLILSFSNQVFFNPFEENSPEILNILTFGKTYLDIWIAVIYTV